MTQGRWYLNPLWLSWLSQIYCQFQGLARRRAQCCSCFIDSKCLPQEARFKGFHVSGSRHGGKYSIALNQKTSEEGAYLCDMLGKPRYIIRSRDSINWFPVWLGRSGVSPMKCKRHRVKVFPPAVIRCCQDSSRGNL